jgi:hypothetical protein
MMRLNVIKLNGIVCLIKQLKKKKKKEKLCSIKQRLLIAEEKRDSKCDNEMGQKMKKIKKKKSRKRDENKVISVKEDTILKYKGIDEEHMCVSSATSKA